MCKSTVYGILKVHAALFPWNIKANPPVTERDGVKRFEFVNAMIILAENGKIDLNRIWLIDEAHFHLQGHVSKQNWSF